MTVIFGIILGSYCLFVLMLMAGWRRMERKEVVGTAKEKLHISVIVACRNETKNIEDCIRSLSQLHYPPDCFEVILVDDHSTDDTAMKIKAAINRLPNFSLIAAAPETHGKKQALLTGIASAQYDCIVTTDADCIVPADWLSYFSLFFEDKKTQLVLGGVQIAQVHSLFGRLQRMEFGSLIGFAASAWGWGRAVLGNGANLGFRKSAFREVKGYEGNLHIASGDDEFLIRKMSVKYPEGITFMNFSESWVSTRPSSTVHEFFNQRLRWAGKWKYSKDFITKALAVYILLVQLVFMILLVRIFWHPDMLLAVVGMKILAEAIYFLLINRFQHIRFDVLAFLVLQIIYPWYVLLTGLLSLVGSFQWKDRNYP